MTHRESNTLNKPSGDEKMAQQGECIKKFKIGWIMRWKQQNMGEKLISEKERIPKHRKDCETALSGKERLYCM